MTTFLSTNFTLEQMVRSNTAARLGIDNTPPRPVVENLERLATTVLEPARAAVLAKWPTARLNITSGYRCTALNAAVQGASSSAHVDGRAADVEVYVGPMEQSVIEVFDVLRLAGLGLDQLIQECGSTGWNHLGIAKAGVLARGDLLIAERKPGGGWSYRKWEAP